jgi:hypothetical protein
MGMKQEQTSNKKESLHTSSNGTVQRRTREYHKQILLMHKCLKHLILCHLQMLIVKHPNGPSPPVAHRVFPRTAYALSSKSHS